MLQLSAVIDESTWHSASCRLQWPSGNMPDCGVGRPTFESHCGQLCILQQPLRYTALAWAARPYCSA